MDISSQIGLRISLIFVFLNFCCGQTCPEVSTQVDGNLNGQRTECVTSSNPVPHYLIYPENYTDTKSEPIGVAFVKDQINDFDLFRDRDLEDQCPSFFVLSNDQIDLWQNSSNFQDVVSNLQDICFSRYFFAEESEQLFPFKLVYKINLVNDTGSEDKTVYEPRKVAVSTPGGNEFIFFSQTEDIGSVCTTCREITLVTPSLAGQRGLTKNSDLAGLLKKLAERSQ